MYVIYRKIIFKAYDVVQPGPTMNPKTDVYSRNLATSMIQSISGWWFECPLENVSQLTNHP